ncbi:hypothetical protein [Saccharothrix sp. Mg75]
MSKRRTPKRHRNCGCSHEVRRSRVIQVVLFLAAQAAHFLLG